METTDLRTEFTKETKTRFNTEWLAYNDYVDWLEQKLVKLLTIPPVIKSLPDSDEIRMKARELDEKDFVNGCTKFKRAMFYNGCKCETLQHE